MNIQVKEWNARRLFIAILALVLVALALTFGASIALAGGGSTAPLAPAQQVQPTGVVTAPVLNVRAGPGVGNEVIGTVRQGELVTIVGKNTTASWYQIRTSLGLVGWASSAFIDIVSVSTGGDVPATAPFEASAVVDTGTLNVRTAPNLFSAVVTTVNYGDGLTLLGRTNDATWLYVRTETNSFGWVSSGLVLANLTDLFVLPVVTTSGVGPGQGGGGPLPGGSVQTIISPTNLRVAPSFDAAIITTVAPGTSISLTGRNADATFAFGSIGGAAGWVPTSTIANQAVVFALPAVNDQGQAGSSGGGVLPGQGGGGSFGPNTGVITAFVLNVRAKPGFGGFVLTTVERGDTVTVLGRLGDGSWYKIQTPGGVVGWSSSAYIDFVAPPADIPIVAP